MACEQRPFLASINERPYDDGPRLVYADWLEEHGDPRAELYRLQCMLAQEDSDSLQNLHQRVRFLIRRYGRQWAAEDLRVAVAALQEGALAFDFHRGSIFWPIVVDPRRGFRGMIHAGHYDEVIDVTARRFPFSMQDVGCNQIALVRYFADFRDHTALIERMLQVGLRPVTIRGLLAFGARYPHVQRAVTICAIGSRVPLPRDLSGSASPVLYGSERIRVLSGSGYIRSDGLVRLAHERDTVRFAATPI